MRRHHDYSPPPLTGELVVRNGDEHGTTRPLLVPFTLLGSADHCDLRILDFTVRPVHCAVSVTPEGPHLRSLGGGTTVVNGLPTQERLLQVGDILTIGPVELEVRWFLPPTPIPNSGVLQPRKRAKIGQPSATPVPESGRKIARMKSRLAQGRLQLARERNALRDDVAKQLIEVQALRQESASLKVEAVMELTQLRGLRKHFLGQWRRYWRRRRTQLDSFATDLQHERTALDERRRRLEADYADFAVERDTLQRAHDECQQRCQRLAQELKTRTQELDQREAALVVREQQQATEQVTAQRLRDEIAGLETRIHHLRTALPTEVLPTPVEVPPVSERFETLQAIASDLADQQYALAAQVQTFAHTAFEHCLTHDEFASELEAIARGLWHREQELQHNAAMFANEREQLVQAQACLREQQTTAAWEIAHAQHVQQRTAQREAKLQKLTAKWAARRQAERATVQQELQTIAQLRGHIDYERAQLTARTASLTAQARALAIERTALEQVRHEVLPNTDTVRVERHQRRLRALFAKSEEYQRTTLAAIHTDTQALQMLHTQTLEQLACLAGEQRTLAALRADLDQRSQPTETHNGQDALSQATTLIVALRSEVARLTSLVDGKNMRPGPRRAA